jgi:hypothetical protein
MAEESTTASFAGAAFFAEAAFLGGAEATSEDAVDLVDAAIAGAAAEAVVFEVLTILSYGSIQYYMLLFYITLTQNTFQGMFFLNPSHRCLGFFVQDP